MNHYRVHNLRTFKKELSTMKRGDRFYVNAINLPLSCIDYLRLLITDGYVEPDPAELSKVIKPEAIKFYKLGSALVPQMTYIVKRGLNE